MSATASVALHNDAELKMLVTMRIGAAAISASPLSLCAMCCVVSPWRRCRFRRRRLKAPSICVVALSRSSICAVA